MASKNGEVTSFSVDVPVKKESQLEKSKQITFCWDNLTVTAKGTDARKGLCGTKIGRRDFVPDKNILQNGKSTNSYSHLSSILLSVSSYLLF